IRRASKLILPGIGAFDHGMRSLEERGLIPVLNRRVMDDEVPVLGICLGMQLLTRSSEEGVLPGLGWINGRTVRFRFAPDQPLRIPHMGWNRVVPRPDNPLIEPGEEARFYFVHSYHVVCEQESDVLGTTRYGRSEEHTSELQSL